MNSRKSFSFSSEAFAGMRITHRHQKEAQPEGQHDDIQHEVLLVAVVSGSDGCAFRERRLRWIKSNNENRRFQHQRTRAEAALLFDHPGGSHPYVLPRVLMGSFGWGLQQLISQFVVAGVALCHIFQRTTLLETCSPYHPIGREKSATHSTNSEILTPSRSTSSSGAFGCSSSFDVVSR